jgi:hypothetical protein
LSTAMALHFYPSTANPGTPAAGAKRLAHMRQNGLTQCRSAGSRAGKPCWITECNFNGLNAGPCPIDDTKRTMPVRELPETFTRSGHEGRLKGLILYTWQGQPHASQEDPRQRPSPQGADPERPPGDRADDNEMSKVNRDPGCPISGRNRSPRRRRTGST